VFTTFPHFWTKHHFFGRATGRATAGVESAAQGTKEFLSPAMLGSSYQPHQWHQRNGDLMGSFVGDLWDIHLNMSIEYEEYTLQTAIVKDDDNPIN
jgi:hypothetical protein